MKHYCNVSGGSLSGGLGDFGLFGSERDNSLLCATPFFNFSESKRLHSKERKQKIFAAQSPPRKRGFFSTNQTIVGNAFQLLRNSLSSLADAPHCSMGLVSKQMF